MDKRDRLTDDGVTRDKEKEGVEVVTIPTDRTAKTVKSTVTDAEDVSPETATTHVASENDTAEDSAEAATIGVSAENDTADDSAGAAATRVSTENDTADDSAETSKTGENESKDVCAETSVTDRSAGTVLTDENAESSPKDVSKETSRAVADDTVATEDLAEGEFAESARMDVSTATTAYLLRLIALQKLPKNLCQKRQL